MNIDKKQELLTAALELFYEKGYEKTTINDIINKVGVSKGAFYHYFQSKEEVIETISSNYAEKLANVAMQVLNKAELNALEKLNLLIEQGQKMKNREKENRKKIKQALISDENLKLQKKLMQKISMEFIPFYEQIISEGIEQGIFASTNKKEMAELFINTGHNLNSSTDDLENLYINGTIDATQYKQRLDEKLDFYEEIFTRILKIQRGSIQLKQAYLERLKVK
ncbi:TetR/AcrR family transcriptional regulator [Desulfuribacillus alkaliarsenatis]|uniref:HTH tetR-type domain-containing protein n=1 Tax=Desulfuribacillus alkaliarsenatis TaxID=766136 RepID=A0A1E5G3E3_9FIRM|nr:TetR/AcrR family transcriptional regulator [Desulfuribacillus alkaliarsenatis]OEF97102.1 hypothetical protein BHF68_05760 [Desulfuribacillus alkaliarsenatis]